MGSRTKSSVVMKIYSRWKRMSRGDQVFATVAAMFISMCFMLIGVGLMVFGQYIDPEGLVGLIFNYVGSGILVVASVLMLAAYPMFALAQYRRR